MMTLALAFAFLGAFQDDKAQADKQAEEAVDAFKAAYKSASDSERASAVTALAGTHHPKTLGRIVPLLTADAPPVRIAAAKGLSGFTDYRKQAAPALARALAPNAKEPNVLIAILESLGKLGDASTLAPAYKLFDEKDPRIAGAAFGAVGEIRHVSSVDILLEQLKKLERQSKETGGGGGSVPGYGGGGGYNVPDDDTARRRAQDLLPAVNRALQSITREKYNSYADWLAWWTRNRGTFKSAN